MTYRKYSLVWECLVVSLKKYGKNCAKMKKNGIRDFEVQPTKGLVKRIVLDQHGCLTTMAQTTAQESVTKQYIAARGDYYSCCLLNVGGLICHVAPVQ